MRNVKETISFSVLVCMALFAAPVFATEFSTQNGLGVLKFQQSDYEFYGFYNRVPIPLRLESSAPFRSMTQDFVVSIMPRGLTKLFLRYERNNRITYYQFVSSSLIREIHFQGTLREQASEKARYAADLTVEQDEDNPLSLLFGRLSPRTVRTVVSQFNDFFNLPMTGVSVEIESATPIGVLHHSVGGDCITDGRFVVDAPFSVSVNGFKILDASNVRQPARFLLRARLSQSGVTLSEGNRKLGFAYVRRPAPQISPDQLILSEYKSTGRVKSVKMNARRSCARTSAR